MEKYFMKVQADFIKSFPKLEGVIWGEDRERVYLPINTGRYGLIGIPRALFVIDVNKLKKEFEPLKGELIQKLIGDESEFVPAEILGTKLKNDREFTILENSRWTVYVDSKLLKHFPKTAKYRTSGEITKIRVYGDDDTFLGIVMPVNPSMLKG